MANVKSPFREFGGGEIIPVLTGNISIEVEAQGWEQAEYELATIAGNLEDREEPLFASVRILADDMQKRFDTETDPDGDKWYPLDEDYLNNKVSLGYPEDILHRTGDLERAATNPDAFVVTEDAIYFDASGLPEYGLLHQTGTGDPLNVGSAARHKESVANEPGYASREGAAHSNQSIGRGNALPSRPFIGMSEEAEGALWALFDLWFSAATHTGEEASFGASVYIRPSGVTQSRTPGGQFGGKVNF